MNIINMQENSFKTIGVDVKFLKPNQVKEIWPLINTEGLVGAIQHPEDNIQPADELKH